MTTSASGPVDDYLSATEAVLRAGRQLLRHIDSDRGTRDLLVQSLEEAAESQSSRGERYRAFMFDALASEAAADTAQRERISEDTLASVFADVQVAGVLLAAGQALGETEAPGDRQLLEEGLDRLEGAAGAAAALSSADASHTRLSRFGFAEPEAAAGKSPSDSANAAEAFTTRATGALTTFVEESQGVIVAMLTSISKVAPAAAAAALGSLGKEIKDLPRLGRLFKRGLDKLQSSINALVRFLGPKALEKAREYVEKLWDDLKDGKHLGGAIGWAIGVEAARSNIKTVAGASDAEKLKAATEEIDRLVVRFKDTMGLTKGIGAGVSLAATVLFLVPGTGQAFQLVAASAYVLIAAAVLLTGMDYMDDRIDLGRVRGVGQIIKELA